ncbi:entericidin A/B family lipoprotein [Nitrogeniibacter aestuarii]|nr:entericidin A/B family lipoprotein [Nitrogeniibacter aestuarii]
MKIWIATALTALFAMTGCNTIQGAGEDIEAGGEKVQETAKDVKKDM